MGIWERFDRGIISTECCNVSDGGVVFTTVEEQVAFAQTVAALVNSSDRGCIKTYNFSRGFHNDRPDVRQEPKLPPSAYFLFVREQRKTLQGDAQTVAKMLQSSWKNLDPEKKAVYIEEARKLRQIYDAELRSYMFH